MICLHITANTGPVECCRAVAHALRTIEREAAASGVALTILEQADGPAPGTLRSLLLALEDGAQAGGAAVLAASWSGTILWVWDSGDRPGHRRKNWFISGSVSAPLTVQERGAIVYQATRASGPGGQHVNKTDSAVRATHIASGISVKVQAGRSQHANKRLAAQLIGHKLDALARQAQASQQSARRMEHHSAERGNARRRFFGSDFMER